jgi:hypothetical protein
MPYLVKAVTTSGIAIWLTPRTGDFRSISERLHADLFETRHDAQRAIEEMPRVFAATGIRFSIETTALKTQSAKSTENTMPSCP